MNDRRFQLQRYSLFMCAVLIVSVATFAHSATLRIAVASNFATPARILAQDFAMHSPHRISLALGSTGKHYAQILQGAPYDAFFAADARRPRLLEQSQRIVPGTRFTYAIGRIVLWSPSPTLIDPEGAVLATTGFTHLALANPKLAPYGHAAQQVLQHRGLWDHMQARLVRGENIGQTLQFIHSGNAELGFVALAQLRASNSLPPGSQWLVPQKLHDPIVQQAVLLRESSAGRAWLRYVQSEAALAILRDFGYTAP